MAGMRTRFAAACGRVARARGPGFGAGLSEPAGAARRAVPARRHQRHRRPRHRAASRRAARQAGHRRQSRRRRRRGRREIVANAPKDGHTLLIVSLASAVNPWLYTLPYDPLKSFAPISMLVAAPNVVTVNPGLPVNSIKELVALAKAKARRIAICVVRRRHVPASGRRAVQDHRRRRHPAHSVPRRGSGADRCGRRPHQGGVRLGDIEHRPYPRR